MPLVKTLKRFENIINSWNISKCHIIGRLQPWVFSILVHQLWRVLAIPLQSFSVWMRNVKEHHFSDLCSVIQLSFGSWKFVFYLFHLRASRGCLKAIWGQFLSKSGANASLWSPKQDGAGFHPGCYWTLLTPSFLYSLMLQQQRLGMVVAKW